MELLNKSTKVDTSLKQIIEMSLPIWAGILIMQINYATNTYFLGHAGSAQLAANAVAGIYYMVLTMVGYGFANGLQVMLSRKAGMEDKAGIGKVFSIGIILAILFAITLFIISLWLAPIVFNSQIHNATINVHAQSFINIRLYGLLFSVGMQLCNQFFIATKRSKYTAICILVATTTNILLDYMLIKGHWGAPALDIKGAAWASNIAETLYVLTAFVIIKLQKLDKLFVIKPFAKFDFTVAKEILVLTGPTILQYILSISSWLLFFIYVEHLGKNELAASQILRSLFGVIGASSWALASTANAMVSNLIGQQRQAAVIPTLHKIVQLSVSIALLVSCIYLLFPKQLMQIYTQDAAVLAAVLKGLNMVIFANILLSFATVYFHGVLGTGSTKTNLVTEVSAILIYIVYIYYVIELKRMGIVWAWGSEVCYWLSLFFMSISFLKWGNWQKSNL